MTSNDAQIDVLLRRYAGKSPTNSTTEHLDADELNAFAQGSLPAAARARYVSHLLDCDNCRQIVSQLTISSGAIVGAEALPAIGSSGYSWWKRLSGFFSPMTLRYAAFAMVLITVAGGAFLVMRRTRDSTADSTPGSTPGSTMVARNDQAQQQPQTAVKPPGEVPQPAPNPSQTGAIESKQGAITTQPSSQSSPIVDGFAKLDQPKTGDAPAAPAKAAKEAEPATPVVASKKPVSSMTENTPGYSPPPPLVAGQRAETQSREQQQVGGAASTSGPRQATQQYKIEAGRDQATKDIRGEDDTARLSSNQAARKRDSDEKTKGGPRRDMDNNAAMNRSSNEVRPETTKSRGTLADKPADAEERAPETRSAGGRKFKRQGNAWVDVKFKSSLPLRNIARGSSEFDELDSGLRSIAQQLSGEVIVVWKGKAYVIR